MSVPSARRHTDQLQRFGLGDRRVVIAVLDGPVDRTHPSLRGAELMPLQTLVPHAAGDGVATAHGTHVASVIFGQPGSPIEGVAPLCTGLLIPIFSDQQDNLACSQLDLARAVTLAVENGAHVINISGGQLAAAVHDADAMLAQAIETCHRRNILVVAAAGNDGCDCLHVPAAIETVLAVGAMADHGQPLASSNWGGSYLTQGLLAPGEGVLGAALPDGVTRRTGTSFAAPYVSGVAGLLLSRQLALGHRPDPHAVRAALLQSASPCAADEEDDCRRVLGGRIDVEAAFELVSGGVKRVTDTTLISPSEHAASEQTFGRPGSRVQDNLHTPMPPWATHRVSSERSILMSEDVTAASAAQALGADVPFSAYASPESRADAGRILPSCGDDKACSCGGAKAGGCGCGGNAAAAQKPQLVYALGRIGYDFGTEARRDSYLQAIAVSETTPFTDVALLDYLSRDPSEAQGLIWTLNLDATPIYAIQPIGAFAALGYERLREFFDGSLRRGVELVSVPGVIGGSVRLQSGQVVPVIVPAIRGMFAWAVEPLVTLALGKRPSAEKAQLAYDDHARGLSDFLNRVYYDLRNLGITPEDRALNYAATNAVQIADVIRSTTSQALDLDTLRVKRSPICRQDSECYDVEISFFNPNNTNVASRIFRFTVDVSDIIPVSIGPTRSWTRR